MEEIRKPMLLIIKGIYSDHKETTALSLKANIVYKSSPLLKTKLFIIPAFLKKNNLEMTLMCMEKFKDKY